ncbi:MAG: CDP-glucose 4,6-dehydratase [Candidatus Neomarinimicrobiota bacterium]
MEKLEMISELKKYYKGKKVYLTGHTGFKGSWMLVVLDYLGANVKGYALKAPRRNDLFYAIDGEVLCDSQIDDIRDRKTLSDSIKDFQPDIIFHFAAQALVRESYSIPVETFDINVMGSVHVLDAMLQLEKPCSAVMITTDKVYENMEWDFHYKENDRLGGFDPYSSSKAGCEIAISSYQKAFFNLENYSEHQKALSSARGGNVIGGGDWSDDRIIPDLVRALSSDKPLDVRNPKSIRPWQHVLELLYGYLLLAMRLQQDAKKYQGAYNFGPEKGDEMTVEELVRTAIKVWGSGHFDHKPDLSNLHEAGILRLDIDKAKSLLKWIPKWTSAETVEKTMSWYKDFCDGESALELCRKQIREYFE